MYKKKPSRSTYRSFFWPILLLGAGVIWLLVNMSVIPEENLWFLYQLWPALIIVAGLDVMFARRLPLIGVLLALLLVAGVVYVLLTGAALGLEGKPEPQMDSFELAVGETQQVQLDLKLSTQDTVIKALEDSNDLIEADVWHYGDMEFIVDGSQKKHIEFRHTGFLSGLPGFIYANYQEDLTWHIGLNPDVPFSIHADASTGHSKFDLSGIRLEELVFDGSTGRSKIILPESTNAYQVTLEGSTGAMWVSLPTEANLTLHLEGSTGEIVLDAPEGAPIQVEVLKGGTGDVILPAWVGKTSGREDRDEGLYQSESFTSADFRMQIIVEDISTGNIVLE